MGFSRSIRLAVLVAAVIGAATIESKGQYAAADLPVSGDAGAGRLEVDRAVLRVMQEHHIPGASLAVARNGSLVLARGYGWANVGRDERVRPQTLFALASVSKSITAATILKLADWGRLDLDARMSVTPTIEKSLRHEIRLKGPHETAKYAFPARLIGSSKDPAFFRHRQGCARRTCSSDRRH